MSTIPPWLQALEKELTTHSLESLLKEGWVNEEAINQILDLPKQSMRYAMEKKVDSGEFETMKATVLNNGIRRAIRFYRPVKVKPLLTRKKK